MKQFKKHWCARPLSWLLSALMVWPALLGLMAGGMPSAQAQAQNGPPQWAVLDFENTSGYGRGEVGRIASDAFVVELGKSNKYDVLSRTETQQSIVSTGITMPPDAIGLQRLGRTLGVAAVATGRVAAISFSNSPRQATVSVLISVTDTNTGELVNGALAQGRSNPRAIGSADDDALVNEAINNASFAAVRQITQFNLPKATVLNARDQSTVLVNRGSRDGLRDGLNMVVTRNGSEVGRIRISSASSDQSDAIVTQRGLGIQPGDRATAIYQLPLYTVDKGVLQARDVANDDSSAGGKRNNAFKGVTGILIALLAGALLLALIRRGSASGSLGGATVGKALAIAGRQDVLNGGKGDRPGTPPPDLTVVTTTGSTVVFSFAGDPTPPADPYVPIVVRVTATTGNIPFSNFVEYHVYRSDFPFYLNSTANFTSTGTGGGGGGTAALTNFGQVPLFSQPGGAPLSFYDDGADKNGVIASKPAPIINTSGTGGSGNSGNNTAAVETATYPNSIPGTGIQRVGARLQYFIEGLYIQPATDGGSATNPGLPGNTTNSGNTSGGTSGNTSGGTSGNTTGNAGHGYTYQLTGRTATNYVTYLEPVLLSDGVSAFSDGVIYPPSITSPTTSRDNVVVNVKATPSGDDYILELSADAGFAQHIVRLTPQQTPGGTSGPYSANPLAPLTSGTPVIWFLRNGGGSGQNYTVDSLLPNATQIFARIGVRDSRNGPLASINPYVYSDPISLSTLLSTLSSVAGVPGVPAVRHK